MWTSAATLAKFYLEGHRVGLEGEAEDRYGRRLAKVKLPSGQWYSDIMRARGYDKRSASTSADRRPGPHADAPDDKTPSPAGRIWVRGHYRSDGTWVSGHWRRHPDP